MKKIHSYFAVFIGVALILSACVSGKEDSILDESISGTYSYHIGGYDWGPAVDTVFLEFNEKLDEVPTDAITITETKEVTDFTDDSFPVVQKSSDLEIAKAYFVDDKKIKSETPTNKVAFEIAVNPNTANPLYFSAKFGRYIWSDPYTLTFTLKRNHTILDIDKIPTEVTTVADDFDIDSFEASDGTLYNYAHYSPEFKSDTLFVWLHGGTEGAAADLEKTDPSMVLLANKASVLSNPEFQEEIGGAHILAPQSPTMWMDMNGQEFYTIDGSSTYEESLHELIMTYKNDIGAEKVILAGPSNGGFMTLRLAILYPDAYDALIPIAHGYHTTNLSDEKLHSIKHIPMFFIYAESDDTLPPEEYSIPVIKRLCDMNADDIKVSSTRSVIDLSGEYRDRMNLPYTYNPHWSWIYFYNNNAKDNENGVSVFDWIGAQIQQNQANKE